MKFSKPRWSPRERIPLLGKFATLNISRRGVSLSLHAFGFTWNSRGRYSVNGPGPLDFRGTWRDTDSRRSAARSRGTSGGTSRGTSGGNSRPAPGNSRASSRGRSRPARGNSRTGKRGTPGQSRGWVGFPHADAGTVTARELCGRRRDIDGGGCVLPAGHQSRWHEPPTPEEPWRDDV